MRAFAKALMTLGHKLKESWTLRSHPKKMVTIEPMSEERHET
jgi:hypothetical protein